MTVCGSQNLGSRYLSDSKTCVFSHYDIAKEFGLAYKKWKTNEESYFCSVLITLCELNNGKYDYYFITGEIKKG